MRRRIILIITLLGILPGIHGILSVRGKSPFDSPIWFVQLHLATRSGISINPDARIHVSLNPHNETWISPARAQAELTANLLLDHVETLGDIQQIAIELMGGTWCPNHLELWVNAARYFDQEIDCPWISDRGGARHLLIRRGDIHADEVSIRPYAGTIFPWEDMIEGAVGHAIAHDALYWSGGRPVTVVPLDPQRLSVKLSLSRSPDASIGPLVDVTWTIRVTCNDGALETAIEDYRATMGMDYAFGQSIISERLSLVDFATAEFTDQIKRLTLSCE